MGRGSYSGPPDAAGPHQPGPGHVAGLAYGSISHMTELTDVPGAFGYGDSILVGDRVRLRGMRDDDLPTLAKWEMDPGRMATLSNWVAPPSEAAAKERIAKWSANEKDDLGFAIVSFLVSDDAAFVTGQTFFVDGGLVQIVISAQGPSPRSTTACPNWPTPSPRRRGCSPRWAWSTRSGMSPPATAMPFSSRHPRRSTRPRSPTSCSCRSTPRTSRPGRRRRRGCILRSTGRGRVGRRHHQAQPEATLAVGADSTELAPLHGQAAWLARRVPVHPVPRLLRTAELAAAAAATLGEADAMVLRGNGAVTTGTGPGIAVARMHLLATACRAHAATRNPVPLDDDDITAWRAAAPPLLARLWLHLARTHPGGIT